MIALLSAFLFGYGLYLLLCSMLKIPDDIMTKLQKRFNTKTKKSFIGTLEGKVYDKIIDFVRFDEIKKKKLVKTFFLANIEETPEQYYGSAYASAITWILMSFVMVVYDILFNSNMSLYVVIAISTYSIMKLARTLKEPNRKIEINRKEIESKMYPFVISVEQELLIDTDIIRILENFKNRTNGILKKHLEITLSEARVSNIVNALIKLESRINSTMVSDVVRGLISLSRGENNREYFSMLASSFKTIYINQKKAEADLIPGKISKYSFLAFVGILVIAIGIMLPMVFSNSFF